MTQEDWVYLAGKIYRNNDLTGARADYLRFQNPWVTFGSIWEWATKQEWWPTFLFFSRVNMDDILEAEGADPVCHSCMGLVNPARFPELVVAFLREREKGEGE